MSNKRKISGNTTSSENGNNNNDCDSLKELCRSPKSRQSSLTGDTRPQVLSTSREASLGSSAASEKTPRYRSVAKETTSGPQGRKKLIKVHERIPDSEESDVKPESLKEPK